jgi:hypothetical protein
MKTEPQKEHEWLQQLVGEWIFESECIMEPGKPPENFKGSECVRSLGGLWVLCESQCEMPGGGMANMLMTLGYDPQKQKYVGTWVGSMMAHLWMYEGAMDAEGKALTLNSEGPNCAEEGKLATYKDVIEFPSDYHRVQTSYMLSDEGEWRLVMTANYRRKT